MTTLDTLDTVTDELVLTQLSLEEEMTKRGADRYIRSVSKSRERGSEDGTAYGKQIVAARIDALSTAITSWVDEVGSGKPGPKHQAYKLIKDTDAKVLAFLTLKHVMAGVSGVRTLQYVAVAIGTAVEDEMRFAKVREEERSQFDKLVKGAKKRTSGHYKRVYATRMSDRVIEWGRWSRTERLHVGVKLLDIMIQSIGLVEITTRFDGPGQGIKHVVATPETLAWIEKKNGATALLRPIYEPMVVPPRDWTTPWDGGYLSSSIKPLKLVKTKNRAYLEELENVDMPIVYASVNAIQKTAWRVNSKVLEVMQSYWDLGVEVAGLPPRGGVPLPNKPWDIETNEVAQREYRSAAAKIHMENISLLGQRLGFNMALDIARRYERFERIYFPYQLDFRGRIYAVPHLNPQGSDYQKALIHFANGKPVGEEGWKWLAIHGANLAGYDKASLEDRVNWVLDNEEEILAIAADPFSNRGWASAVAGISIDKPWQFLGFCFEWAGYVEKGEDFVSCIPVAMDGSCSGIQHFSAMLRDEKGGAAVNLVPQELPADVYRAVAEKVIEQAEWLAENGEEDSIKHNPEGVAYVQEGSKTIAQQWLKFGVTRKVTKRSVN